MRALLASILIVSGLGILPAHAAASHDVPWYAAHQAARATELGTCNADPGDLARSPDCINAEAAERHATTAAL